MKVLHKLDRNMLVTKFHDSRDFQYIAWALSKHRYFYLVALNELDLTNLILNSSPQNPKPIPNQDRHPTLGEAIKEITDNPEFLNKPQAKDFRGLNGLQVKEKIAYFEQGGKIKDCFMMDVRPEMFREEPYYVIDGMHSLVAYALWSKLKPEKFPIQVICCTNTFHP